MKSAPVPRSALHALDAHKDSCKETRAWEAMQNFCSFFHLERTICTSTPIELVKLHAIAFEANTFRAGQCTELSPLMVQHGGKLKLIR